jgi:hypothetical protein
MKTIGAIIAATMLVSSAYAVSSGNAGAGDEANMNGSAAATSTPGDNSNTNADTNAGVNSDDSTMAPNGTPDTTTQANPDAK